MSMLDKLSGQPRGWSASSDLKPTDGHTLTQSERLYILYMLGFDQELCRSKLAAICLTAIGDLTPPWIRRERPNSTVTWRTEFHALRYKARAPWVYRWIDEQLKVPQMDLCRYIGKRCRQALVDEIRAHTRKHRQPKVTVTKSIEEIHRDRTEMMAVLGKILRHAGDIDFTIGERALIADSIMAGKPLSNVSVAKQWGCSEGKIRKMKAGLFVKLQKAKKARQDHWYRRATKVAKPEQIHTHLKRAVPKGRR